MRTGRTACLMVFAGSPPCRKVPLVAGRGTTATIALERAGIPFTRHEYAHDRRHESYGLEASQALGVPPERVFKTLVAEVDGALVVGVVPVEGQLDLKALAGTCGGKKAVLAEVTAAERATGYVAGGISPVGQRKRLPVVSTPPRWTSPRCSAVAGGAGSRSSSPPPTWSAPPRPRSRPSAPPGGPDRDGLGGIEDPRARLAGGLTGRGVEPGAAEEVILDELQVGVAAERSGGRCSPAWRTGEITRPGTRRP